MVPFWSQQRTQFFAQLDRHLLKADFTIVDLTNFPKNIQDDVANYVLALSEKSFSKIIPVGF